MSLFGSIMRDFDHDPYFSSPMNAMRRMETMMNNMMMPFDNMLMAPPAMGRNALMPFGFGRSLFPNMGNMLVDFESLAQNPNCHSYSSSSMMSFTTDENGRPQVYQSTSSTRTAPGGVKETRKTYQDTSSGMQSMAIGHHLGERAHVIEKAKNRYTGEENENQEFINLEEEEAQAFNEEWQNRVNPYPGGGRRQELQNRNYPSPPVTSLPAIAAPPPRHPPRPRKRDSPTPMADNHRMEAKQKKRNFLHNLKMKGNHDKSKHAKN